MPGGSESTGMLLSVQQLDHWGVGGKSCYK